MNRALGMLGLCVRAGQRHQLISIAEHQGSFRQVGVIEPVFQRDADARLLCFAAHDAHWRIGFADMPVFRLFAPPYVHNAPGPPGDHTVAYAGVINAAPDGAAKGAGSIPNFVPEALDCLAPEVTHARVSRQLCRAVAGNMGGFIVQYGSRGRENGAAAMRIAHLICGSIPAGIMDAPYLGNGGVVILGKGEAEDRGTIRVNAPHMVI